LRRKTAKLIHQAIRSILALSAGAVFCVLAGTGADAQSAPDGASSLKIVGDEASRLDFGAGAFNIQGHQTDPNPEGRVEFRYGGKLFYVGPALGVLADTKGALFGYGGVYSDIAYGHFVITPLAAIGGYHRGASEDLGETFQFRLSMNVAYELNDGSRLGVQFAHISNAGIADHNPGDNELLATYAIPLNLPF
jgi:hypothetical protein